MALLGGWVVKSKEEICVNLYTRPPQPPSFLPSGYRDLRSNNMISKWEQFVDFREKYGPVGRLHDVTCDLELGLHRTLQLLLLNRAEQEEPAQ